MLFSFEVLGKGDLIADFKKKFVTFLFENEIQFHQIYVESDLEITEKSGFHY